MRLHLHIELADDLSCAIAPAHSVTPAKRLARVLESHHIQVSYVGGPEEQSPNQLIARNLRPRQAIRICRALARGLRATHGPLEQNIVALFRDTETPR